MAAQKVFAAKLDGRDLAAENVRSHDASMVADRVEDLLETFIVATRLSKSLGR